MDFLHKLLGREVSGAKNIANKAKNLLPINAPLRGLDPGLFHDKPGPLYRQLRGQFPNTNPDSYHPQIQNRQNAPLQDSLPLQLARGNFQGGWASQLPSNTPQTALINYANLPQHTIGWAGIPRSQLNQVIPAPVPIQNRFQLQTPLPYARSQ